MLQYENLWASIQVKPKPIPKRSPASRYARVSDEDLDTEELQELNVFHDAKERVVECWVCSREEQVRLMFNTTRIYNYNNQQLTRNTQRPQIFSIHYGHAGSACKLNWKLSVDGVAASQLVTTIKPEAIRRTVKGITNAEDSVLPFKFARTWYSCASRLSLFLVSQLIMESYKL